MLPPGGQKIHDLRVAHKRPAGPVLCSTIGRVYSEFSVSLDYSTQWDLLWAVDLDIVVLADSRDEHLLNPLLMQFKRHRPKRLAVWFSDLQKGAWCGFSVDINTISRPLNEWVWVVERDWFTRFENESFASSLVEAS